MGWVVVQTKSQCEDYAIHNLEKSGFKCYNPKITLRKGISQIMVPMFRGYVFVEIDLGDVRAWRSINSHRGVVRILGTGSGIPLILPKGWVENLWEKVNIVQDEAHEQNFQKGEKIKFTAGPLCGIHGIIQSSNRERVALLVNLLGSDTIIQSSTKMISLASAL